MSYNVGTVIKFTIEVKEDLPHRLYEVGSRVVFPKIQSEPIKIGVTLS